LRSRAECVHRTWPRWRRAGAGLGAAGVLLLGFDASADLPVEKLGQIETLSRPFAPHQVWVADLLLQRTALMDLDEGRFLGQINGGYGPLFPLFAQRRQLVYVPSTFYSRLTYGERTDAVVIWDARTLAHVGEVLVPAKRALDAVALGHSALSDDERFIALYNYTPATSLSIVDIEARAFVTEVSIPGCGLVYAAGDARFFSLCGDGSLLSVEIEDDGAARTQRIPGFCDPTRDPVTEKAVRIGDRWIFVSFEGMVHSVDVSGPALSFEAPWSLVDDRDRAESWRTGGKQHLAAHVSDARLFVLMHQGGPDTHKDFGEEVWVYDFASQRREQRITLRNPGVSILGFPIEFGDGWVWPFTDLSDTLLDLLAPAAIEQIAVTQDQAPLLVTATSFSGSLGIYDARAGEWIGRVPGAGFTIDLIQAPWRPGVAP
jgi:methylamine dehydrogenase heavy chain